MMFGRPYPDVPNEISLTIFQFIPKKMLINSQLTCQRWKALIREEVWKKTGAVSYDDFVMRMRKLPLRLRNFIIDKIYTLSFAEELQELLKLNCQERARVLLPLDILNHQNIVKLSFHYSKLIVSDNWVFALKESLISIGPLLALPEAHLHFFIVLLSKSDVLLDLLRKKIVTLNDIEMMPNPNYLKYLFSPKGLTALLEGSITPAQAARLPHEDCLAELFSDSGFTALTSGKIKMADILMVRSASEMRNMIDRGAPLYRCIPY